MSTRRTAGTVEVADGASFTVSGTVATSGADGSNVVLGSTTDAAVTTDANGTISGKLRGLVKWASERMPATLGQLDANNSLSVVIGQGSLIYTLPGDSTGGPGTFATNTLNQSSFDGFGSAKIHGHGILGCFDDTSPTTITENNFGTLRISTRRELYGQIRDAAGNERGVNVSAENALNVTPIATTAGGSTSYSFISTAAVQAAEIKGSAGQVYGLLFFNDSGVPFYGRIYNQTGTPGTGDAANIKLRFMIPGSASGAGYVVPFPVGLACGTGIGIRVSAAIADNDATALIANALFGNVLYK